MSDDKELKCDYDQYALLLMCSEERNIEPWNKFRKKNEKIWLEGVNLSKTHLEKANLCWAMLKKADLSNAHLESANLMGVHLEKTDLENTHFKNANLKRAHFEGAVMEETNLQGANLRGAYFKDAETYKAHFEDTDMYKAHFENAAMVEARLERANLRGANFKGAALWKAHLEDTCLDKAHFEDAELWKAHLERAKLKWANLEGTNLEKASLEGAIFFSAIVNSKTYIVTNKFDEDTNFTAVALDNCRIDPRLKASLKTIIRKKQWEMWYQKNPWLKIPVCLFWKISDYGSSTGKIIVWFFGLAFIFGLIYFHYHNILDSDDCVFTLSRSMYFSIVTMTTLGFGDIHARADNIAGHIILSIHVITGYVLLGALITRLGILFTQEGPAYPIPPAIEKNLKTYHGTNPCLTYSEKIKDFIKQSLKQIPTKLTKFAKDLINLFKD